MQLFRNIIFNVLQVSIINEYWEYLGKHLLSLDLVCVAFHSQINVIKQNHFVYQYEFN